MYREGVLPDSIVHSIMGSRRPLDRYWLRAICDCWILLDCSLSDMVRKDSYSDY